MRKRYWILIAFVVLLLPLGLNWLILQPRWFEVVGDGTHWLSFWGGYISAIISAGVAFVILHKQIKVNQEVNEKNRLANETQNERNKELQLKLFKHSNAERRLDILKQKMENFISSLDLSAMFSIRNDIENNNDLNNIELRCSFILKAIDKAEKALEIEIANRQDFQLFNIEKSKTTGLYRLYLADFAIFLRIIKLSDPEDSDKKKQIIDYVKSISTTSYEHYAQLFNLPPNMAQCISQYLSSNDTLNKDEILEKWWAGFILSALDWNLSIEKFSFEIVKEEQTRIDNILEDNDTE